MREGEVMYNTGLSLFHSYVEPFAKFYSQTSRKVILMSERAYTRLPEFLPCYSGLV
jgi:hypothetical protein